MATNDDSYMELARMIAGMEEAIRLHRDVVNRAIGLLNREVIGFTIRLDKDDAARAARQKELDAKLDTIQSSQDRQRRWQWIRIGVEVGTILIAVAFWLGSR